MTTSIPIMNCLLVVYALGSIGYGSIAFTNNLAQYNRNNVGIEMKGIRKPSISTFSRPPLVIQSNFLIPSKLIVLQKSKLFSLKDNDPLPPDESNNTNDDDGQGQASKESPLDKALAKARARAEIKRLTTGPDAVYDPEAAISELLDNTHSHGIPPNSSEASTEEHFYELESKMSQCIKSGDFVKAASCRDEMDRLHLDDCGFVLQTNSKFYECFSKKDYKGMSKVWLNDNSIQCVHPSHKPLVGYAKVMESWKTMFETNDETFQLNTMEPANLRLSVKGCTAWLTCDEEVYAPKFVRGLGKRRELVKKMMATNIFRKVDGSWSLVHHHATWHTDFDNTNTNTKKGNNDNPIQSTSITHGGLNGLLGGGGTSLPGASPSSDGVVKKVFMGSLSDLLNGGLSDILGDAADKPSSSDNSGKTYIHVSGDFDDDDEEGDEDDDHEDVDDADVQKSTSKQWNHGKHQSSTGIPKDALRQNCISALRKLTSEGCISQKQKRVLQTDIITCSAKGEFSMVEVAYELLCGEAGEAANNDEKEIAEEEFADQCRYFANLHSESNNS